MAGDTKVDGWRAYNAAPWGRLRLALLHSQLFEALDDVTPGRALDVGCGLGETAVALAERGWEVLAVDRDPDMVTAAEPHDLVTYEVASAEEVDAPAVGERDLVVCHNVLAYIDDGEALVRRLASLVPVGGHLSIAASNVHHAVYGAAALRHDLGTARAMFDGDGVARSVTFDEPMRLHDPLTLDHWIDRSGLGLVSRRGGRVLWDHFIAEEQEAHFDELLALELDLARRSPHSEIGGIIHRVARRIRPDRTDVMGPQGWIDRWRAAVDEIGLPIFGLGGEPMTASGFGGGGIRVRAADGVEVATQVAAEEDPRSVSEASQGGALQRLLFGVRAWGANDIAFPLRLEVTEAVVDVDVDGQPTPFQVLSLESRWVAWATIGDRHVILESRTRRPEDLKLVTHVPEPPGREEPG